LRSGAPAACCFAAPLRDAWLLRGALLEGRADGLWTLESRLVTLAKIRILAASEVDGKNPEAICFGREP